MLLIVATLGLSWLLMMAVHELGHALNAWLSGASVQRIVLHPLAISRTDVSPNPHPLLVAAGGAMWGTLIPLGLLGIASGRNYRFLLAFFAGFCCLANGIYLAAGSLYRVGDAGDLLRARCRALGTNLVWDSDVRAGALAVERLGTELWFRHRPWCSRSPTGAQPGSCSARDCRNDRVVARSLGVVTNPVQRNNQPHGSSSATLTQL